MGKFEEMAKYYVGMKLRKNVRIWYFMRMSIQF
jgi:hypothetical protein